jgi:hypothetical protein
MMLLTRLGSVRAIRLVGLWLSLVCLVTMSLPAGTAAADRSTMDVDATYEARAKLTWGKGQLDVWSRARIRNTSGHGIERIDFNVVPARIGNMRNLKVWVDGDRVPREKTGQTVKVPLGRTLANGERVTITISYRSNFRPGTAGHDFLFSKQNRIMSAMRWIPWVSREVRFQVKSHGDPFVTGVSKRVEVTLESDVDVRWGTSGRRIATDGRKQTYLAENVRDFNFTAARDYRLRTGKSIDGRTSIKVYTRTISASTIMTWARRSLDYYSRKVGRYPYPTLVISESSGSYAMESPALVWLPAYYATSRIPFVLSHEVAHQWFYGVVGNDQTTNPFLDEAMAEFLTRSMFGFRASRCATKRLDLSMYSYTPSCYYEQVYVQGSSFLNKLRQDMGSGRFWDVIGDFWRANRYEIVTTKQLLEALRKRAGDWVLPRYRARFPGLY